MIKILLLIIFIEALTEIIVASAIFAPIREVSTKYSYLGELMHCGYCTSVWVSASVAWIAPLAIGPHFLINYALTVFILHRLSNLFHEFNSKWLNRRPLSLSVYKTETVIMPGLPTGVQGTENYDTTESE